MNLNAKKPVLCLIVIGAFAAAVLAGPRPTIADVVVLADGTRLEGIATTSSLMPDILLFSDHVNESLRLPRSRVREVIREPEPVSRLRIARALAEEGKYQRALDELQRAKKLAPDDPAILEEEQTVLRALDVEAAKQAEVDAQEARGLLDKIREAMKAREFEKAVPWFALLGDRSVPADVRIAAAGLQVEFFEQWGDYRADKTDTMGAIHHYETVMDLNPNNEGVYKKLMRLYEKAYRPGTDAARAQRLEEYLEAKVAQDPKDMDARLRLANLLYMRKDWDGALENYMAVYKDNETTGSDNLALPRVEARLAGLLDQRHRETAQRHDYDAAIEQFREYQSLFPGIDNEPLLRYEYMKKVGALAPTDTAGRLELVRYCEKYGLDSYARKDLLIVLQSDPENAGALSILSRWAQADMREIERAFQGGFYAQIPALVGQFHNKYPAEQFPSLKSINDAAEDFIEKARNESRAQLREKRKRAEELADQGDQNFERGMDALQNYRSGADTRYRGSGSPSASGTVFRSVGSYKADAIMYFERALRYYREALAIDPSLADAAKRDLKRKIDDTRRFLNLLKSQRRYRLPPGKRSARRFKDQTPAPQGYWPYNYPYIQPLNPSYPYVRPYPYGGYPVYPGGQPYNPYPTFPR